MMTLLVALINHEKCTSTNTTAAVVECVMCEEVPHKHLKKYHWKNHNVIENHVKWQPEEELAPLFLLNGHQRL